MPRKKRNHNAPFFRTADGWWYAQLTINGARTQKKLIKGFENNDEAYRLYHTEKAQAHQPAVPTPSASPPLVLQVIDDYLSWCRERKAEATYVWYFGFLQDFARHLAREVDPKLAVDARLPLHVDQWTFTHRGWSQTTKRGAMLTVQRVFRWAERRLKIPSPLVGMEKPAAESREVFLTAEQFHDVLTLTRDPNFADLLQFLWNTGARPQEAFRAEDSHFDGTKITFPIKQAKGKKKARVIYLNDKTLAIVKRRIAAQGPGPIFRHCRGGRWNKNNVNVRSRRLRVAFGRRKMRELNLPPVSPEDIAKLAAHLPSHRIVQGKKRPKTSKELLAEARQKLRDAQARKYGPKYCLYHLRHSFATLALLRGVDPVTLSHLMGHSDLKMITKVYVHLAQNDGHLLDALTKATG
jgi:integrase/recombinase XerD